jgi:hypothetical protein
VLVKHGLNGWVLQEESTACFKLSDLLAPLEALGSSLAETLARQGGSSEAAVSAWRSRLDYTPVAAAQIVTGFSKEELELIQQASDEFNSEVLRHLDDPSQSELLAAARMSSGLTPEQIAAIVSFVASVPAIETSELDDLSTEATAVTVGSNYAYDEGFELARWLRQRLGIGPGSRVNPEDLLSRFSVSVQESRLASSVDAVAVWGRRHGPCVLINTAGKHTQGLAEDVHRPLTKLPIFSLTELARFRSQRFCRARRSPMLRPGHGPSQPNSCCLRRRPPPLIFPHLTPQSASYAAWFIATALAWNSRPGRSAIPALLFHLDREPFCESLFSNRRVIDHRKNSADFHRR